MGEDLETKSVLFLLLLLLFCFLIFKTGFLCVDQAVLELTEICLPLPP